MSLLPAPLLPDGFTARRPRPDDLPALVELYNAVARQRNLQLVDETDLLAHRTTARWWTEALVLEDTAGRIAAYAHFNESVDWDGKLDLWVDGRVHPDATGHGLATFLLERGEVRAWAAANDHPPHVRLALRTTNDNGNDRARALYERLGFTAIRHRLAMRIDLARAARQGPRAWGLTIRPFDPDRDAKDLWRAMQDGFADHHDFAPTPYEDWRWILMDRHDDFDPGLWHVAEADGEIVGGVLAEVGVPEDPNMGLVRDLAVIPKWRRRGAADALLRASFGAFLDRGLTRAGLDVDDTSITSGAVRLYERAGMAAARRIDIYEKELRPAP